MLSNPALDEDDFEFIELKNVSSNSVDLVGAKFTDGITFEFTTDTTSILAPGERLLLVKDTDAFQLRYGQAIAVGGQYSGSLSNGGERIRLVDVLGNQLLDFEYQDGFNRLSDGLGFSLQVRYEDVVGNSLGDSATWRASAGKLGSPGTADEPPIMEGPIVINEVLAHTDLPQVDAVELRNLSNAPVDISHWWLTDDLGEHRKYQFPANTTLPASGYLLADESDFHRDPQSAESFLLSSLGDEIWLLSANSSGDLTGYLHGFEFGANENGVTLGRVVNSVGKERAVRQSANTLSARNSTVATGPVIISEVMYHPPDLGGENNLRDEFIELRNPTDSPVMLYDPEHETNVWEISNGVDFAFPPSTSIPAHGHILVVGFDPANDVVSLLRFLAAYGLGGSETILGPFDGKLNNNEERVTLRRPDSPQPAFAEDPGFVPMIEVDSLRYGDGALWSTGASGTGLSLQRLSASDHADEPLNWMAAGPTPGSFNGFDSMDGDGDGLPTVWEIRSGLDPEVSTDEDGAMGDPDHDGVTNLDEWRDNTAPMNAADKLELRLVTAGDGPVRVLFSAPPDRRYVLQSTMDFSAGRPLSIYRHAEAGFTLR